GVVPACCWPKNLKRQVAEELGDSVKVVKVDVDENRQLSTQLKVSCSSWRAWRQAPGGVVPACCWPKNLKRQVAEELGDSVKVVKVDVDENRQLSTQLKIEGLPTMVFIPKDASRPALRTEGLLPAAQIIEIVREMSSPPNPAA
ncbi:hypothetical protein QJQ45_020879, partial [Haematococcus lacustris]